MRIPLSRLLVVCCVSATLLSPSLRAQEHHPGEPASHAEEQGGPPPQKPEEAAPVERSSVTEHQMTVNGNVLHYTATAGTLLIRNQDDKPYGSIFYVAYTLDGADPKTRPVTFLYNGGPGSASLWLHMGSVGPVRVVTDSPDATGSGPYQIVPNQYTLLDQSDLVFIDAPLTGYSRAVGKGTVKDFAGVDQDLKAFTKFIERYLTVNQRWNSPKFLFGESYGTTRSAGLSATLQEDGVSLNGITLLSSVLNYNASVGAGLELSYVNYLPSYAAIAFYHKKLPQMPSDMVAFVEQAREFARGEYAEALAQGDTLPQAQMDAIAQKLNHFTGLPVEYLEQAKLRVNPSQFRAELLRGDGTAPGDIMGRYDARFEGTQPDDIEEFPSYDPSDTGIAGAYTAAIHDYLSRELKYDSPDEYKLSADTIGQWDWHHHAAGGGAGYGRMQELPDVTPDLADTIRKNPKLMVFSANGWFDLATPFFATEYELNHMMLTPQLQKNVQIHYYPAGHMVYLNVDALRQMREDLRTFYNEAEK